jgi:hypothetical protein
VLSLELAVGGQAILDEAIRLDLMAQQIYDECRPPVYPIFFDSDWAELWDVYSDFDELFCEPVSNYPAVRAAAASGAEADEEEKSEMSMKDIVDLAHKENISEWIESISERLSVLGGEASFQILAAQMGLSKAELWMGLLMGGFRLTGCGSFYGEDFSIHSQ